MPKWLRVTWIIPCECQAFQVVGNGDGHEHGLISGPCHFLMGHTATPLREEWGFVFPQIYPPAHTKMEVTP